MAMLDNQRVIFLHFPAGHVSLPEGTDGHRTQIITSHLTATLAWDDHQSDLLLQEIAAW